MRILRPCRVYFARNALGRVAAVFGLLLASLFVVAAERSQWAEYVQPEFPFYSSVVDGRPLGAKGWPTNNLTSRGIILKVADQVWACFDTELLRLSALWSGSGLTPVGMAPGSYHDAGRKAQPGQVELPMIQGELWLATGLHAGWHVGEQFSALDPRPAGIDARELSRGPLPEAIGRFSGVQLLEDGVELHYMVGGVKVREWFDGRGNGATAQVRRSFTVDAHSKTLWLALGQRPTNLPPVQIALTADAGAELVPSAYGTLVRVAPATQLRTFTVSFSLGEAPPAESKPAAHSTDLPATRWGKELITRARQTGITNALVIEHIDLPVPNPWRRNVRPGDIAFFKNGRAAVVTFDGDVWTVDGLAESQGDIRWRRFTSGLHEPMGIAVRNEELFVHDRNGIWRLRDSDANGEADVHELFSNAFVQTAETREFAAGLRVAPDGSFVIGKGGIQASSRGLHNGSVLRIAADGKSASVLGWGLREPFIGVHPRTGLVTASDQQGNYIPATPLHIIRDGQFYGFLTGHEPKDYKAPTVAEPIAWIPHPINASGVGQVWLTDSRMGLLNDALIHIGYYRPELFLVRMNERNPTPEAAIISITRALEFAPLHGAVNPADGFLYVTGFQIWGSDAAKIGGLARLRPTGETTPLPREVVAMKEGLLLRFDLPLDAVKATNIANYSAERWAYRRTAAYGSPHFKLDGSRGQEALPPSSVYLSADKRAVFIGIPDMRPAMQMRFGWTLGAANGLAFANNAYFSPRTLPAFDSAREGFGSVTVDLTPRPIESVADVEVSAAEGSRLVELMGCVACHSTDGTTIGKVGPSFKNLFQSERRFADGTKGRADENYIRQSIKDPPAKIVYGFDPSDTGMPSYDGTLTESQIESIILHLKTIH